LVEVVAISLIIGTSFLLGFLEDFVTNKNNKEKIPKNHFNDLHNLTHKNKIWQNSSIPPILLSKVFWNLSLGRTGSVRQIYLNRWQTSRGGAVPSSDKLG
jgi:hypothetical protein